jgi:thiamine-monophosphate kinase
VGDLIAVTGRFGLSALKNYAVAPPVRLKEGQLLGQHKIASALIDSSDGLVASVEQLCSSSGTGAVLDLSCIPRARGATLRQALYGGEDYELVFTFPPSKVALLERLEAVTIVGRVVEKKKGLRLLTRQRKIQRPQKGYDHFKND